MKCHRMNPCFALQGLEQASEVPVRSDQNPSSSAAALAIDADSPLILPSSTARKAAVPRRTFSTDRRSVCDQRREPERRLRPRRRGLANQYLTPRYDEIKRQGYFCDVQKSLLLRFFFRAQLRLG